MKSSDDYHYFCDWSSDDLFCKIDIFMFQLKIKYSDILMLEKACFYYSELDVELFSDKHSYMYKQSVAKHLYNKKIKRLADNVPNTTVGRKAREKTLNLEYFEATILTEVLEKYTYGNKDMAYEVNFNRQLLLMIQDKQLAVGNMGFRR